MSIEQSQATRCFDLASIWDPCALDLAVIVGRREIGMETSMQSRHLQLPTSRDGYLQGLPQSHVSTRARCMSPVYHQLFEGEVVPHCSHRLHTDTLDSATIVAPLAAFEGRPQGRAIVESTGNTCGPAPGLASRPLAFES
jgi:hypothetical protein